MSKKQSGKNRAAVKTDKSPFIPQRDKFSHEFHIRQRDDLTERQKEFLKIALDKDTKVVFVLGPAGTSKAQPLDAKILTPKGWISMGDITPGSLVYSDDGKPTIVESIHPQGIKPVYKITFSDNTNTECTQDHLWFTQTYNDRTFKLSRNNPVRTKTPRVGSVKTTEEIMKSLISSDKKKSPNHSIPITLPIYFDNVDHIISPYNLGALLGDGCFRSHHPGFACNESEILARLTKELPTSLKLDYIDRVDYVIRSINDTHVYKDELHRLQLWNHYSYEKFIPNEYKFDSIENRIALLQGLLDTDGSTTNNCATYTSTSERLINDVRFLIESLGGIGFIKERMGRYKIDGKYKTTRPYYIMHIRLPNDIQPFFLRRKLNKLKPRKKYLPIRYIKNIEYVADKECQCIKVANPSHLYLTNNCIVTHNTFISVLAVLEMIQTQRLSDLLYIRSVVECSDQKMGFLPGTEEDKMGPYMAPLLDKLDELLEQSDITALQKDNRVSAKPIGFLRGLNWNAKGIIADEAQNFTFNELVTLMTRVGQFSKLFICGDLMQSDIAPGKSGLEDIVTMFNSTSAMEQGIFTFEFTEEDIVRSPLVRFIVKTVQDNIKYVKSKR